VGIFIKSSLENEPDDGGGGGGGDRQIDSQFKSQLALPDVEKARWVAAVVTNVFDIVAFQSRATGLGETKDDPVCPRAGDGGGPNVRFILEKNQKRSQKTKTDINKKKEGKGGKIYSFVIEVLQRISQ